MIRIATVSDLNYLYYVKALFTSALKNNKNVEFYLYYVGSENVEALIKFPNLKIYKDTTFIENSVKEKPFETEDVIYKKYFDKKTNVSKKACYCNNIRFKFADILLREGVKSFFLMDADMLCERDISVLKVLSRNHDLCIQPYYEDNKGNIDDLNGDKHYCVNFMLINNTPNTLNFFNDISISIDKEFGIYKWGHAKYFKNKILSNNNIKIFDMPWIYRDTNYNNDSYVWSGENFRKNSELVKKSTNKFQFIDKVKQYNHEYTIRFNN